MKWFTGLNSHNQDLYVDYLKMYKVAVITAKKTNPNLEPYLILDGEIDSKIQELVNLGVNVIKHTALFYDEIISHYKDDTVALGVFLRIDLPKICEEYKFEDEFILYTDNDVMFMSDISDLNNLKPKFFAACGEFNPILSPGNMNSGVMWINWKSMLDVYDDFVKYIVENFSINMYDQDPLKKYFNGKIDSLNPIFNYRPYWGKNDGVKIIHFHGPKPTYEIDKLENYVYPSLVSQYFWELKNKFEQILENT